MTTPITPTSPRTDIHITFARGGVLAAAPGTTLEAVIHAGVTHGLISPAPPIVAAVVDDRLRELTLPLTRDVLVTPIPLTHPDGMRIYRRSLIFLLVVALHECLPGQAVDVGYALPDGGYYCRLVAGGALTPAQLRTLDAAMRAIVQADEPIARSTLPLAEVQAIFAARGDTDKVRLLESRDRDSLVIYTLRGYQDYFFGYMLPSTGYLSHFRLLPAEDGLILQYPRHEHPDQLGRLDAHSKMGLIFRQTHDALDRMGIEDVGRLNQIVRSDNVQETILIAEAFHEQMVGDIAQQIAQQVAQGVRLVAIAGPTSSGKTTFSKRLALQLRALGVYPLTIELDNFFVDREHTPRDAEGGYNFESLEAINLTLLNDTMRRVLEGEPVQLPRFNFLTGRGEPGARVQLLPKQIIVTEGIHGLNPRLLSDVPAQYIHHLYISVITQLNIDRHNRVSTSDVRLLRRIVRDARARGYSASDTINRWQSVRRGEKMNIFPYQEHADAMFNSALVYELAALRPFAEPLLLQVVPGTSAHIEANRLLSFLHWVQPLTQEQLAMIPDTSLLREFIGGSVLERYHPGALGAQPPHTR